MELNQRLKISLHLEIYNSLLFQLIIKFCLGLVPNRNGEKEREKEKENGETEKGEENGNEKDENR